MKNTKILCGTSLIIFLGLFIIALVNIHLIQPFDDGLRAVINAHRTVIWNTFFINFTQLFNTNETIIWIVITLILCWVMTTRRFTLQVILTLFSGIVLNRIIKVIVQRPRPATELLMHYGSYSFPSGHSSAAVLVLGCLILLTWRVAHRQWVKSLLTIFLVCLALAIGFSRVYVGAHYPSDVIAGWCLGTFVVTGYQLLFNFHSRN